MAEASQFNRHIESYVDVSRSSAQQGASLDAIISLLKNDVVTIALLVRDMDMYLTTADNVIRARGILLLGETLMQLHSKPLENSTVHSLITFFTDRLADWRALRGAVVGCLALIRRKSFGVVSADDAVAVARSYVQQLQVQSLAQHDRKLCFELLECLLERHSHVVTSVQDHDFVYGILAAIDGEKDPQCLMLTFHIVELLVKAYPHSSGPVSSYISDIFSILGCYFPIHFTHPTTEGTDVTKDDLSTALMMAFAATPLFEPFAVPLLLEKLSSSLPSAKVDSLKSLNYCATKYGTDRMGKHAKAIWSSLKDTIYATGPEPPSSFSLDSQDAMENEIPTEAFGLLEKMISLDNGPFVSLITSDEDINTVFNTISSYNSYDKIPLHNKRRLLVIGHILYVSAQSSVSSCQKIVECFLPRLMEGLELSLDSTSSHLCNSNGNGVLSRRTNFGSLYLSIELLKACRDLRISNEDLVCRINSQNDIWCCLLQRVCGPLSETFSSFLEKNEPANDDYLCLAVKGLQVLALLPGGNLLISNSTFEVILGKLVSVVLEDSNKIYLWRLALKALVDIGRFIENFDEVDKEMRYINVVVEKFAHLVEGNITLAKTTSQLLECYSTELIPWYMQNNEGSEEMLLRFADSIWKTIESLPLTVCVNNKELLDAMIKVMKLAVACCGVESQNLIVNKAYSAFSSITSFPIPLEEFKLTQEIDKLSNRDDLVLSLFASVVIGLHPQAEVPNLRSIAHVFRVFFLEGNVIAAQAYGSMVNKLNPKSSVTETLEVFTLEQAIDMVFSKDSLDSFDDAITGLAWIGKGLLMRGHERVKDIVMLLLKCLLEYGKTSSLPLKQYSSDNCHEANECFPSVAESAADAFQILVRDSDLCLNREFHAMVRPLYKQRFFSIMMPLLESLIVNSESPLSRCLVYRAFGHVISETPLLAILNDAKKLVSLLVNGMNMLSNYVSEKDGLYSLLLVLSGILTDNTGQEAVIENAHIIVNCLVQLIGYPHRMLVRETAIQCLTAMSQLPYTKIYPRRIQVLQAVSKALDDPKRVVRQEAVKCRQAWASIA
ncbi:unnamed protein product [Linum tenue]|uniref:MMS19 nucleotide excision repair protein n=1 Tax=Linum tenue TaxID=586396 RepID=A0AAV0KMM0_9ROSI|nr:unnamed protein product [Linum tenue]